jgi:hypothetical protein
MFTWSWHNVEASSMHHLCDEAAAFDGLSNHLWPKE